MKEQKLMTFKAHLKELMQNPKFAKVFLVEHKHIGILNSLP